MCGRAATSPLFITHPTAEMDENNRWTMVKLRSSSFFYSLVFRSILSGEISFRETDFKFEKLALQKPDSGWYRLHESRFFERKAGFAKVGFALLKSTLPKPILVSKNQLFQSRFISNEIGLHIADLLLMKAALAKPVSLWERIFKSRFSEVEIGLRQVDLILCGAKGLLQYFFVDESCPKYFWRLSHFGQVLNFSPNWFNYANFFYIGFFQNISSI